MSAECWQGYIQYMQQRGSLDDIMIISSEDGAIWASSSESFELKMYDALITQEDGSERNETVNEAANVVHYMNGGGSLSHGLRINGTRKQQITRTFKNHELTDLPVIFSKFSQGGSCIANAKKCILIGTYDENKGHTSHECNDTITNMAAYLSKSVWPTTAIQFSSLSPPTDDGGTTWQTYIDKILIGKGNILEAMIVDASDGSRLASTAGFELKEYETEIPQEDGSDKLEKVNETKNLLMAIKGSKPSQGLRINQVKYQIIRSAPDEHSQCFTVHTKKSLGGCTLTHCGKVALIATFDETKGHTASGCNLVLSDLAKYLKEYLK